VKITNNKEDYTMAIDTNISYFKEDVGKNLYRKKTYYTLVIEQEVLAKDKDEADVKFSECGIDHSQINHEITETKDGVETYMVDANYSDSGDTEYIGKVTMMITHKPLMRQLRTVMSD
jgi:hypothetical protein